MSPLWGSQLHAKARRCRGLKIGHSSTACINDMHGWQISQCEQVTVNVELLQCRFCRLQHPVTADEDAVDVKYKCRWLACEE